MIRKTVKIQDKEINLLESGKAQDWVSVLDALPSLLTDEKYETNSRQVLFTDGTSIFIGDLYFNYYDQFEDGMDSVAWQLIGPSSFQMDDITHWMDLPKLPKNI